MKSLVFSLACFLVVGCGSSKGGSGDASMGSSGSAAAGPGATPPLQAVYEIRERESGDKVGMVYKRDHDGRSIYWVYDGQGTRRGFVTPENRGYAYSFVLGKRSDKAEFIGEDTLSALSRRLIDHGRAVRVVQVDLGKYLSLEEEAKAPESDDSEPETDE